MKLHKNTQKIRTLIFMLNVIIMRAYIAYRYKSQKRQLSLDADYI